MPFYPVPIQGFAEGASNYLEAQRTSLANRLNWARLAEEQKRGQQQQDYQNRVQAALNRRAGMRGDPYELERMRQTGATGRTAMTQEGATGRAGMQTAGRQQAAEQEYEGAIEEARMAIRQYDAAEATFAKTGDKAQMARAWTTTAKAIAPLLSMSGKGRTLPADIDQWLKIKQSAGEGGFGTAYRRSDMEAERRKEKGSVVIFRPAGTPPAANAGTSPAADAGGTQSTWERIWKTR